MNKEYSKQPEEINKITGITPYLLIITMNVNGLFFFGSTVVGTQGLVFARQVLYHLSYEPIP
jgi:hypothetical protein